MKVNEKRKRRFSEEFRRRYALLVEKGEYTIPEVCRKLDVHYDTVKNWVIKFGKEPYPQTKWIITEDEINKIRKQEKEIDNLKKIIGEQQIKILLQDKLIEIAKEKLGPDFEKKA